MRTTIEIPEDLRQKLVSQAAARHKRGFSEIIVEALEEHFQKGNQKKEAIIKRLHGCLSEKEYKQEMIRLKEERKNWRVSLS